MLFLGICQFRWWRRRYQVMPVERLAGWGLNRINARSRLTTTGMGSLPIKGVREGHGPASCDHYVTKPNSREAYSASFGASTKRPMALTSGLRVRFRI